MISDMNIQAILFPLEESWEPSKSMDLVPTPPGPGCFALFNELLSSNQREYRDRIVQVLFVVHRFLIHAENSTTPGTK